MSISKKIKKIDEYCSERGSCDGCPLNECPEADCYYNLPPEIVERNYKILFGDNEDIVNHPSHYTDGKIEVIDFIEDKKLGFCLGNAIKYIARAGKKDPTKEVEDLKKARWYIERRIKELEEGIV